MLTPDGRWTVDDGRWRTPSHGNCSHEWFRWPKNLNPLHPKICCAMLGWYWPIGSGVLEKKISKCRLCFFAISLLSPLENDMAQTQMWKMWKVNSRTDGRTNRRTDVRQEAIRTDEPKRCKYRIQCTCIIKTFQSKRFISHIAYLIRLLSPLGESLVPYLTHLNYL